MRVYRVPFRLASPVVAATSAAALFMLAACEQKAAPPAPQIPEVSVVTVQPQSVAVTTELPGRVNSYLAADVRARVDGVVLRREFVEGSDVKQGQRLYLIDPAPSQAAYDSAVATLQKAQANVVSLAAQAARFKTLVAANAVSKQDYDNAVASLGQAQADVASGKAGVETARINLSYTSVVSPITGRIGKSAVTPGAYVQASAATLLSTVQQIDPVYVDLTQSSLDGLRLRRDFVNGKLQVDSQNRAKVSLILEDGTPYPITGTLQFSDISVDSGTGSVDVRAVFPNPRHELLPGMFVRARLTEGSNDRAMLVPEVGITHNPQGQATTYVVGPDNKVSLRVVTASRTIGDKWVIDAGLNPGDRVIVAGVQKIQPGGTVKPVELEQPAAPAAASQPAVAANAAATQKAQ
ncbi:efflux RND transporter periplasmic adaptor subunit [Burkholderia sp. L27(2015)]|uniref:efflux RND transporter periplasmic adaptor subunit n=1 Tax=Burkholderia sp. L27(2015) TaxID=1641858 RepID=UPI00131E4476|nr:efflux RND transporter periplasmic adaptor subunit [Burkholderia sp. L27(2015)]